MNQCGACGLDFGSVGAFDAHRVGKHAYLFDLTEEHADGRRCIPASELQDAGWGTDSRGRWRMPGESPWAKEKNE